MKEEPFQQEWFRKLQANGHNRSGTWLTPDKVGSIPCLFSGWLSCSLLIALHAFWTRSASTHCWGRQNYPNQATAICQVSLKWDLSALEHCNLNHSLSAKGASASWPTRWTKVGLKPLGKHSLYTSPDGTADHNMVLCCDPKIFLLFLTSLPGTNQHQEQPGAWRWISIPDIHTSLHLWGFSGSWKAAVSTAQTFSLQLIFSSSEIKMESLKIIHQNKKKWCLIHSFKGSSISISSFVVSSLSLLMSQTYHLYAWKNWQALKCKNKTIERVEINHVFLCACRSTGISLCL